MVAVGTRDARDVILELEDLRKNGRLARGSDGEFQLRE